MHQKMQSGSSARADRTAPMSAVSRPKDVKIVAASRGRKDAVVRKSGGRTLRG